MVGKTQPSDAPKVQVQSTGIMGETRIQQISLDSNRLRVKTESLQRFSNFIAIPSRGMWLDAVQWVLTVALIVRLALTIGLVSSSLSALGIAWGLSAMMAGFPLVTVFLQVPDMRPDCFIRFCQISAGVCLATQFFWIQEWWL